jgi:prolyl-tRNA editing enzyme YbaK/EbsC (Cys-tRNA(Pro) deacylase)
VNEHSNPEVKRVLEAASRKGVTLDVRVFERSTHTAEDAAAAVDTDLGRIVKSLVFVAPRYDGKLAPIICLVSGRNQVDLALLAAVTGEVIVRPATAREVRELTGFAADGVPPIGHARSLRVLMDQELSQYEWVWASAGADFTLFRVSPSILRMLANAVVVPLDNGSWMPSAGLPRREQRLQLEAGSGA